MFIIYNDYIQQVELVHVHNTLQFLFLPPPLPRLPPSPLLSLLCKESISPFPRIFYFLAPLLTFSFSRHHNVSNFPLLGLSTMPFLPGANKTMHGLKPLKWAKRDLHFKVASFRCFLLAMKKLRKVTSSSSWLSNDDNSLSLNFLCNIILELGSYCNRSYSLVCINLFRVTCAPIVCPVVLWFNWW